MCKYIIYFFCILLVLSITSASMAGLVAYYPFDEGSGNVATDVSGNGNDGTSTGLVWIDGPTGFGNAIYFDGSNPAANYVNCGTWDPSESTNQLTVALWVRWDGPVTGVNQGIIAKRRTYASQAIKWQLQLDADSPYDLHARNYEGEDVGSDNVVLPQGEWTFIAFTCDSTTGRIYINGVQVASSNYSMAYGDNEQIEIGADNAGGTNGWNGGIDNVQIYDTVLSANEIMVLFSGVKGRATNPEPKNGEKDTAYNVIMNWKPGNYVREDGGTHNVFFSTDFNDVNDATASNPLGATISLGQAADANTFDPGILEFGQTYYWRIDEVNAPPKIGTYKGNIWSFTTEKEALDMTFANIAKVTAISSADKSDANDTVNGYGLGVDANFPDQHSNGIGSWVSSGNDDPNNVWIQYDFDKQYKIHQMLVWNYNQNLLTSKGFNEVLVQYSEDGNTWIDMPEITKFEKAPGKAYYDVHDSNNVFDFNDVSTGHGTIDDAVAAVKAGAVDFITKDPYLEDKLEISVEKVERILQHALDRKRLEEENRELRATNERLRKVAGPALGDRRRLAADARRDRPRSSGSRRCRGPSSCSARAAPARSWSRARSTRCRRARRSRTSRSTAPR